MLIKKILYVAALAVLTLSAQEKRSRIDVESYTIQADVDPVAQMLRATAVVRFAAIDDNVSTVNFELNNALQVTKVLNGQGGELQAGRNASDFTMRVTLPQALGKGKTESLSIQYQGKLSGSEESPIYGIKFAAIQGDFA